MLALFVVGTKTDVDWGMVVLEDVGIAQVWQRRRMVEQGSGRR